MNSSAFQPRTVAALFAVGAVSLGVAFLGPLFFSPTEDEYSVGADSFSRSAIGHRAFVELLRRTNVPVSIYRGERPVAERPAALWLLAEPRPDATQPSTKALERLLEEAPAALVVLPKWRHLASTTAVHEVEALSPMGEGLPNEVLRALGIEGRVVRVAEEPQWSDSFDGLLPALTSPAQLIAPADGLRPLVASEHGVLLGQLEHAERVWVLADPDLLSSQGLARGDNAALAHQAVEVLRAGGPVIVDETLHGFVHVPNVLSALVRFPLALFAGSALFLVGLLVWAGVQRFGPPQVPPPAFAAGTRALVDSTAQLLDTRGEHALALKTLWARAMDEVAYAFHVEGTREHRLSSLTALAARRGAASPSALQTKVADVDELSSAEAARTALAVAGEIWLWKQEMLNGLERRPARG